VLGGAVEQGGGVIDRRIDVAVLGERIAPARREQGIGLELARGCGAGLLVHDGSSTRMAHVLIGEPPDTPRIKSAGSLSPGHARDGPGKPPVTLRAHSVPVESECALNVLGVGAYPDRRPRATSPGYALTPATVNPLTSWGNRFEMQPAPASM